MKLLTHIATATLLAIGIGGFQSPAHADGVAAGHAAGYRHAAPVETFHRYARGGRHDNDRHHGQRRFLHRGDGGYDRRHGYHPRHGYRGYDRHAYGYGHGYRHHHRHHGYYGHRGHGRRAFAYAWIRHH